MASAGEAKSARSPRRPSGALGWHCAACAPSPALPCASARAPHPSQRAPRSWRPRKARRSGTQTLIQVLVSGIGTAEIGRSQTGTATIGTTHLLKIISRLPVPASSSAVGDKLVLLEEGPRAGPLRAEHAFAVRIRALLCLRAVRSGAGKARGGTCLIHLVTGLTFLKCVLLHNSPPERASHTFLPS